MGLLYLKGAFGEVLMSRYRKNSCKLLASQIVIRRPGADGIHQLELYVFVLLCLPRSECKR